MNWFDSRNATGGIKMKFCRKVWLPLCAVLAMVFGVAGVTSAAEELEVRRPKDVQSDVDLWATFLKDAYFKDVTKR